MKNRKIIILILIFFIIINCLTLVSATDNTTNDNLTDFDSVDKNSFKWIQKSIDSSKDNDTLILNGTYYGDGSQIVVNKSITIEGINNTTLDANKMSRVFYIKSDNVILKNLNIINGYHDNNDAFVNFDESGHGGAIYWKGNNGSLIDSNVQNNIVKNGLSGAIYWVGNDGTIINTSFKSNQASLVLYGGNGTIFYKTVGGSLRGLFYGDIYGDCNLSQVCVNSKPILTISNTAFYYGEDNLIKLRLSSKDIPWCNETLNIYAFNSYFNLTTNSSGEAIFKIPKNINAGNYLIESFNTDKYRKSITYHEERFDLNDTKTVSILDNPSVISVLKTKISYSNELISVKITSNRFGSVFSGVYLSLKINGKIYYGISDSKGNAAFKINNLDSGKYDIEIKTVKNAISKTLNSKITIKKVKTIIKQKINGKN